MSLLLLSGHLSAGGGRMKRWIFVTAGTVLAILASVAMACDDGEEAAPTPTAPATEAATATAPATAPLTPPTGRTGIPELDAVIDAMVTDHGQKETPALAALIGFTQVPCISTPEGIGAPPLCELNEEEGQLVEVFNYGACE